MLYSTHIPNLDLAWQVYRSGSLRAAAESVGLSHTTLGRRIRKLESDLSICLFTRHGRKIRPTPTADSLLPKYFERIQALQDEMHDDHQARTREAIRIDATLLSLFPGLMTAITTLRRQHPIEHYVLTDTSRANLRLSYFGSTPTQLEPASRQASLVWAITAHRNLRYDLRKETLFTTTDAPRIPRIALVQYGHIERLPSIHAVLSATQAQLGLGWMPINSGLLDHNLTEASGEHERTHQPITLELTGDSATIPTHRQCRRRLMHALTQISNQSLAESG